MFISSQLLLI